MVEFSRTYSCFVWRCEWGHIGLDFESTAEAIEDFKRHRCNMTM